MINAKDMRTVSDKVNNMTKTDIEIVRIENHIKNCAENGKYSFDTTISSFDCYDRKDRVCINKIINHFKNSGFTVNYVMDDKVTTFINCFIAIIW